MKMRTKLVSNLTPIEFNKCRSLNLRSKGEMFYALPECRDGISRVYLIEDGDKLLAWGLVRQITAWSNPFYEGQFYVRYSHRRKGLGTRLVRAAKKKYPDLMVCPHDYRSTKFFKALELPLEAAPGYDFEMWDN